MKLYFQFLTQVQSSDITRLLEAPCALAENHSLAGTLKILSGGKLATMKSATIGSLALKLATRRFNECELIYHFTTKRCGKTHVPLQGLNGVLKPSPASVLWYSYKAYFPLDRTSQIRRSNVEAAEKYPETLGLTRFPSIFEVVMNLENGVKADVILDTVADCLVNQLPKNLEGLELFGVCDVVDNDMLVRMESNMPKMNGLKVLHNVHPKHYSKLGQQFARLHPLMFGSNEACNALAAAIGKPAMLADGKLLSNFSVVRLPENCSNYLSIPKVRKCLIDPI